MNTNSDRSPPGLRALIMPVLLSVSLCASVHAADDLQQRIVGSWKAVSLSFSNGSTRSEPFGANPQGQVSFDPHGYVCVILMRADLPKIASNNRQVQTPEESHAIATGLLSYHGRYAVDGPTGVLTVNIEGSSFPNWNGMTQQRTVVLEGDRLIIKNQTTAIGAGSAEFVLRKLP